ncbi:MAG: TSCPD domain-containing protein, partial [Bacteroidaceae bacterium]
MEKVLTFKPQNTCSSEIKVKVENDILLSVEFTGGCNGNLQGISQLVSGMAIEDVLCRLE